VGGGATTTPAVLMPRTTTSNTVIKRWFSNERLVHAMLLEIEARHAVCGGWEHTTRNIYSVGHLVSTK
jgi:hypothetical protein